MRLANPTMNLMRGTVTRPGPRGLAAWLVVVVLAFCLASAPVVQASVVRMMEMMGSMAGMLGDGSRNPGAAPTTPPPSVH